MEDNLRRREERGGMLSCTSQYMFVAGRTCWTQPQQEFQQSSTTPAPHGISWRRLNDKHDVLASDENGFIER